MSRIKVGAKGQIALSKDHLKHLGIGPGEKLVLHKLPDSRIELMAARATGKISDAFDFLKRQDGPSLSIDEINEFTARAWGGKR
jgi:hypothetical protein